MGSEDIQNVIIFFERCPGIGDILRYLRTQTTLHIWSLMLFSLVALIFTFTEINLRDGMRLSFGSFQFLVL